MSTLDEIKAAISELPRSDVNQLMRFMFQQFPATPEQMPPPRDFSEEQIREWIEEDEAAMERLRQKWEQADRAKAG